MIVRFYDNREDFLNLDPSKDHFIAEWKDTDLRPQALGKVILYSHDLEEYNLYAVRDTLPLHSMVDILRILVERLKV